MLALEQPHLLSHPGQASLQLGNLCLSPIQGAPQLSHDIILVGQPETLSGHNLLAVLLFSIQSLPLAFASLDQFFCFLHSASQLVILRLKVCRLRLKDLCNGSLLIKGISEQEQCDGYKEDLHRTKLGTDTQAEKPELWLIGSQFDQSPEAQVGSAQPQG